MQQFRVIPQGGDLEVSKPVLQWACRRLEECPKLCPYCLQVPLACLQWLVDRNASKIFSHVFVIKSSPKTAVEKWVENEDWSREHHREYDASYEQTVMEEEAHV
jgi:hypothetical protein